LCVRAFHMGTEDPLERLHISALCGFASWLWVPEVPKVHVLKPFAFQDASKGLFREPSLARNRHIANINEHLNISYFESCDEIFDRRAFVANC